MNPTANPATPPEPQAGATPRKKIKRYSMLTMMGISVMRPEPDGEYVTYQDHIAALATSRAETEAALKKQPINTSLRLFDLVRYMRSELHQKELITDEEYAELCMGPMAIDRKNGGSPSPRRLEEYDALRAQLATLTATLGRREAEVVELRIERDNAVGFASRVEKAEVLFKRVVDSQLQAISEMPLGKTINENLSDAVSRVLNERDTALARVRELEGVVAAADQMRQEWRKRALKVELDAAAARAAGTGEEGAGV